MDNSVADLKKRFPNASQSFLKINPQVGGVLQPAQQEPDPGHDPVAEDPGEDSRPGFRLVRVTSYRRFLLDERNLWDHYLIDALVKAGCLRDDSSAWCKIEVSQVKVGLWSSERTEIEIYGYDIRGSS